MSIPGAASPLFLATTAGGAAGDFEIARSLRFNSADSSSLSRTPSSASNRKTWTWSNWVKRSASGAYVLFRGGTSSNDSQYFAIQFNANDKLAVGAETLDYLITTQVFRDFSAWYHIVVALDVNQGTNANKLKLYINGAEVTAFDTDNRSSLSTSDKGVNQTQAHVIGAEPLTSNRYLNGYLAEINFVDGSQLDPTSFGQADSDGVWRPKDTAGLTFGTNGFRLKFADNSSSAALGTDSSGQSNTWTVNNLSAGVVSNPTAKQNFDVVTWTGNGSSQSLTLGFQPDFIWTSTRSAGGYNKYLVDSVRGKDKYLVSHKTQAEATSSTGITSFNSNGFTVGNNTQTNENGTTMVAWCWKAGGSASSNTDGSGTTNVQVSANTSYGFSIVTYTGGSSSPANSDSGDSFGHGLSTAPKLVICKKRTGANSWPVYHASTTLGALVLDGTNAVDTASYLFAKKHPTSSVVYLGNNPEINNSSHNYVAYCWSEVAGFSKFGTYSGSSSDVTVTTGFKPRYILIKCTDTAGQEWIIKDSERGGDKYLQANDNSAEATGRNVTFNSDGFTLAHTQGPTNYTGRNYIYAAYAATVDESAINDCFVDTPSNAAEPTDTGVGNEVVGNYATLNPLNKHTSNNTLSNGNLEFTTSGSDGGLQESTIAMSSGKFYFEVVYSRSDQGQLAGIRKPGFRNYNDSYIYVGTGNKYTDGGSGASYGATLAHGDVIGTAFDADNGTLTFYKNGVSQGQAFSGISGTYSFFVGSFGGPPTGVVNFGQRAFSYTAPSGHKSLNTANLPTPTIADGSQYFDTKLYTGNGGTQTISGYKFSPDWLWLKSRSGADNHAIQDAVRGATYVLQSNTTNAEVNASNTVGSFTSDGFTLAGGAGSTNGNNVTYAGWAWDGGTSTVTNNDGSIASQVRAQPSAGFSIVNYTATGSGITIGHGLNVAPALYIQKDRDATDSWRVYTTVIDGSLDYFNLETTGTKINSSYAAPTSTVLNIGGLNGDDHIVYCFAPVAGYSAMGQFIGNGSTDGPFIYTGMAPAFVMIKPLYSYDGGGSIIASTSWYMYDSARGTYNANGDILAANKSFAEENNATDIDFLSNGFKLRNTRAINTSSGCIYYAVAENPFQANGGLAR